MDFPIDINKGAGTFVEGMTEMKQNLLVLLTNSIKEFYQSPNLGTFIPIHSQDNDLIKYGIEKTIDEIPNAEIKSCIIEKSSDFVVTVHLTVLYKEVEISLTFNV